jgi:hypothetical protein
MTKYLVTRQNADGSYDEVGMSNRCVVDGYKTFRNAFKYSINSFGNGKRVKVEVYADSLLSEPVGVTILTTTGA